MYSGSSSGSTALYNDVSDLTAIGTDPSGRFEKYDRCLGLGAYKKVFLAFDQEEGVEVAWNELRLDNPQTRNISKILSEIRILQQLRHESIISLYHSWISDKQVIFITELMTSGTLKSYLRKTKTVKPKILKHWCRQILNGLNYLHTRNPPIIHRDIKCENIFINGNNGQAKIGDLGLARVKNSRYVTSVIGTPEFMAPELYDERYDEKVDIYAFGLCVLEIVTKDYPYSECTNQAQIFRKVTNGVRPASFSRVLDPDTKYFIATCIAYDPADRPSAAELLSHPFLTESVDNAESIRKRLSDFSLYPRQPRTASPSREQLPSTLDPLSSVINFSTLEIKFPVVKLKMDYFPPVSRKKSLADNPKSQNFAPRPKQEVQFEFDLTKDTVNAVSEEMVQEGVLSKSDLETVKTRMNEVIEIAAGKRTKTRRRSASYSDINESSHTKISSRNYHQRSRSVNVIYRN